VAKNAAKNFDVVDPETVQASVTLAQQVELTRFDPDYYAIQLGNSVLGGGFYATRLYHDLRQVAGLVYNVDNDFTAGKTRSIYTVTYGSDPPNVAKARDLIARDLRAMQTENVTPEELHQAKALLLRQIALQQSSEDAIAAVLLARAQIGLPLDELRRMGQRYADMTADEIRAAFAKWIRTEDFVQVVRGPQP
jgi:zinc protease